MSPRKEPFQFRKIIFQLSFFQGTCYFLSGVVFAGIFRDVFPQNQHFFLMASCSRPFPGEKFESNWNIKKKTCFSSILSPHNFSTPTSALTNSPTPTSALTNSPFERTWIFVSRCVHCSCEIIARRGCSIAKSMVACRSWGWENFIT